MDKDYRSAGRVKKYGVCLNEKCEQYKQVQEIVHGELECPCCKQKLSPCGPPKKKSSKKPLLFVVLGVVVVAAIVAALLLSGGNGEESQPLVTQDTTQVEPQPVVDDTVAAPVDTVAAEQPAAPAPKPAPKNGGQSAGSGTLKLSYGTYTGATLKGYPHGQGRLTYSTTRQINRYDPKGRTANAGEYVIGEFANGFVIYGKHYDAEGNLLGSLNFGMGPEGYYEDK